MYKFFGKPKPLLKISMAGQVETLGLHEFFSAELWPEAAPVRELLTKVRNLTGEGFQRPFVYAEMRKFLPLSCPENILVLLDEDGAVRTPAPGKEANRRLDFASWLLAWDRYAIGSSRFVCDMFYTSVCVLVVHCRCGVRSPVELSCSNEAQSGCCRSCMQCAITGEDGYLRSLLR